MSSCFPSGKLPQRARNVANMPMVPAMLPAALRTPSRGRGPLFGDLDDGMTKIAARSRPFAQCRAVCPFAGDCATGAEPAHHGQRDGGRGARPVRCGGRSRLRAAFGQEHYGRCTWNGDHALGCTPRRVGTVPVLETARPTFVRRPLPTGSCHADRVRSYRTGLTIMAFRRGLVACHRRFGRYWWSRLQPAIPGRQAEACSTGICQMPCDDPLGVSFVAPFALQPLDAPQLHLDAQHRLEAHAPPTLIEAVA